MSGQTIISERASPPDLLPAWLGSWESRARTNSLAALCLLALTLAALGATLFSRELVFSNAGRDLASQFIHWRKFGFDELRAGRLALWNPHIFCGAPFFGGFQSALLYPPNWLYLCLPLGVAINTGIALHVFLTGGGMFLWMRARGLHPLAALFAGVIFMFSGPVFPHIYAGHLPNLCAMAWGPFIFLAIDGWLRDRTPGWLLLGAAAVAMQILAGHPQYVFYTGVAAGLYAIAQLTVARERWRAAAGLAAFPLAGAALSAVQLFEGFHAAGESVRRDGTSLAFAAKFRLPPENLLTALAPNFFGSLGTGHYWGRWQLWEMCVFFGVTGLVMAGYGLTRATGFRVWSCAAVALALLLLAFGSGTPLFALLYRYAPGFSHFRGWSKFSYPAILLLGVVAATGYDRLLHGGVRSRRGGLLLLGPGIGCAALAWLEGRAIAADTAGTLAAWHSWIAVLASSLERRHVGAANFDGPAYTAAMAGYAMRQVEFTALTLAVLGAILLLARRHPAALAGVLALAGVEMVGYARSCLDRFPSQEVFNTPGARFLAGRAADSSRVRDEISQNLAMSLGGGDLWGYDPGVLRRYAEWMSASQGQAPDDAAETMEFRRVPAVFASLLRLRSTLPIGWTPADGDPPVTAGGLPVPPATRLMLVSQFRVIPARSEELAAIFDPGFDPAREVLLETAPAPTGSPAGTPVGAALAGAVRLAAETTDSLTIEADLEASAILLVTDAYSDGWRARSLLPPGGANAQTSYQVLPADYCLRGIPLGPGRHRILLEYLPAAYVVGKWMSLASLCIYFVGLIAWCFRRPPFHAAADACGPSCMEWPTRRPSRTIPRCQAKMVKPGLPARAYQLPLSAVNARRPTPPRPPPGATLAGVFLALLWPLAAQTATARDLEMPRDTTAAENPAGTLMLQAALRLALRQNPDLAAAGLDVRAAEARTLQAGLLPNPSLIGDIQDFAGGRQYYRGTNGAQITLSIAQLVELGGKRAARVRAARLGGTLARWDYEVRRLDTLAGTAQAFIAVLAAQERLPPVEADRRLAADALPAIDQRITAGAASPLEKARGLVLVANFDVELAQARRDLAQARARLAAQWGAGEARFSSVAGDLDRQGSPLPLAALAARLENHPSLARFPAELDQRRAALALAKTAAVPDVTLTPGYRYHNDPPSANVAVLSAQIGLPFFDRNQGNIRVARAELAKTTPLREAAAARLHAELNDAYAALRAAREEIATLETRVLPAAGDTLRLVNESDAAGKFSYLEMLDARRTLTAARQQLLAARAARASAAARLEALTGGPIFDVPDPKTGAK